jgi:hypothetical protein
MGLTTLLAIGVGILAVLALVAYLHGLMATADEHWEVPGDGEGMEFEDSAALPESPGDAARQRRSDAHP